MKKKKEETRASNMFCFSKCLEHFDFKKVAETMKALKWTWGKGHYPDEAEMREVVKDLYKAACAGMAEEGEDSYWASSGGFNVQVTSWRDEENKPQIRVRIQFCVEDEEENTSEW